MSSSVSPHIKVCRYWADWDRKRANPHTIRRDTRIFWEPQAVGTVGKCVGTFIGENPGGADSIYGPTYDGSSPVEHRGRPGDPTMRLIFEVWQDAVARGFITRCPAPSDYIEVLNTYYFRNPKSGRALAAWLALGGASLYCPVPSPSSRFVLLGWGLGHSAHPVATASARSLGGCGHVLIPDSSGAVTVAAGASLVGGVKPGPVMPSYVLMRSKKLKPLYVTNVAAEFR